MPKRVRVGVLRQDHFLYEEHSILHATLMRHLESWRVLTEKEALPSKDSPALASDRFPQLEAQTQRLDGCAAEARAAAILEDLGLLAKIRELMDHGGRRTWLDSVSIAKSTAHRWNTGVDPLSWTPHLLEKRRLSNHVEARPLSARVPTADGRTRASPAGARRPWPRSSSPRARRSATGWSRYASQA